MKQNRFRSMFVLTALVAMLLLGSILPVAAAANKPAEQTFSVTPVPLSCSYNGVSYPIGSRRNVIGPIDGYWQCELVLKRVGPMLTTSAQWVLHLT